MSRMVLLFFPKKIHWDEPFHLSPPRNYQKFHSKGKRSLKSLHEVSRMVSLIHEKLPIIRRKIARNDPEWETWDLSNLPKPFNNGRAEIRLTSSN